VKALSQIIQNGDVVDKSLQNNTMPIIAAFYDGFGWNLDG